MIKSLDEFQVYQMAMELGDSVWIVVNRRDYYGKDTIGKQLVRSVDSVVANLSEVIECSFL